MGLKPSPARIFEVTAQGWNLGGSHTGGLFARRFRRIIGQNDHTDMAAMIANWLQTGGFTDGRIYKLAFETEFGTDFLLFFAKISKNILGNGMGLVIRKRPLRGLETGSGTDFLAKISKLSLRSRSRYFLSRFRRIIAQNDRTDMAVVVAKPNFRFSFVFSQFSILRHF